MLLMTLSISLYIVAQMGQVHMIYNGDYIRGKDSIALHRDSDLRSHRGSLNTTRDSHFPGIAIAP